MREHDAMMPWHLLRESQTTHKQSPTVLPRFPNSVALSAATLRHPMGLASYPHTDSCQDRHAYAVQALTAAYCSKAATPQRYLIC